VIEAPRYLAWAMRYYGKVPYDLASSGIAPTTLHQVLVASEGAGGSLGGDLADSDGPQKLKRAVARFNGVAFEEVGFALGTTHALWLALASLLQSGDEALVESPGYEPLTTLSAAAGAIVRTFERSVSRGCPLELEAVTAEITPRTRVVVVSNPHNPSGRRADRETIRQLAERLSERNMSLLVDEVYGPFQDMDPGADTWANSARRLGPNVVTVSSLTKSFGLGADRIGWVLAPPHIIERVQAVTLATCGSLPLSYANASARAFAHIGSLRERADRSVEGNRQTVEAWMARHPEWTWSAPEGGLFGLAVRKQPGDLRETIERGASREGVLVAPGAFFGVPNGFRISWSISTEKLNPALERLSRVVPD
jgi:aspartate/methionine/tyrosine aminotransferase